MQVVFVVSSLSFLERHSSGAISLVVDDDSLSVLSDMPLVLCRWFLLSASGAMRVVFVVRITVGF